eukprot:13728597-Alexandrium_andersonii.AAC.1
MVQACALMHMRRPPESARQALEAPSMLHTGAYWFACPANVPVCERVLGCMFAPWPVWPGLFNRWLALVFRIKACM